MKILAFCGGASNADTFRMQLLPIVHALEEDGVVFRFVQGTHKVPPPRGYAEYFGPPPHYTFTTDFSVDELERNGFSQNSEQVSDTPEDTLRNLLPLDRIGSINNNGYKEDVAWLNKILEVEGPYPK